MDDLDNLSKDYYKDPISSVEKESNSLEIENNSENINIPETRVSIRRSSKKPINYKD